MQKNSDTFTESERNSLLVEILMQEGPAMDNVFSLLGFLHREKERILHLLIVSDNDMRSMLWPQLDDVKYGIETIMHHYINEKINDN